MKEQITLRPLKSKFICVQSSVEPERPHINEWFEFIDRFNNGDIKKPKTKRTH